MAFDRVDQAVPNFPELENRILELWKERDVFHRSLQESEGQAGFRVLRGASDRERPPSTTATY